MFKQTYKIKIATGTTIHDDNEGMYTTQQEYTVIATKLYAGKVWTQIYQFTLQGVVYFVAAEDVELL